MRGTTCQDHTRKIQGGLGRYYTAILKGLLTKKLGKNLIFQTGDITRNLAKKVITFATGEAYTSVGKRL